MICLNSHQAVGIWLLALVCFSSVYGDSQLTRFGNGPTFGGAASLFRRIGQAPTFASSVFRDLPSNPPPSNSTPTDPPPTDSTPTDSTPSFTAPSNPAPSFTAPADEELEQGTVDGDAVPGVRGVNTNIPEDQRLETMQRNLVFFGDIGAVADSIEVNDIVTAGFGLRTNTIEENPPITENRDSDPDVIAFKALATAALRSASPDKIGNTVALSFMPDCQCNPFVSEEYAAIIRIFTDAFRDQDFLRQAIDISVTALAQQEGRRKLMQAERAPTSSFVCAGCWPSKTCRSLSWCS